MSGKNADELIEKIERSMAEGNPINELELIFLPLMKSRMSPGELLIKTISLEKCLSDEKQRIKVLALTLVMANRIVEKELIDSIWEEIHMLKVIRYAEEKGIEKGREEGRIKGREEGRVKGKEEGREEGREEGKVFILTRQLTKKFGPISPEILNAIDSLDEPTLDVLSMEILDMEKPEDIRKFLRTM